MQNDRFDPRGPAPLLQGACAVFGGLLLVGILAYAFAANEWNLAGEPPAESEFATIWQRLNTAPTRTDGEVDLAKRR